MVKNIKIPGSSQDWKLKLNLLWQKSYTGQKKFPTPMQRVWVCIILWDSRILLACMFSLLILFKRFSFLFQAYFLSLKTKVFLFPGSSSLASMWWSTHARTKGAIGLTVVLLVSLWKTEAASCIWIRMVLFTTVPCSTSRKTRLTTWHLVRNPKPFLMFLIFMNNTIALTAPKEVWTFKLLNFW